MKAAQWIILVSIALLIVGCASQQQQPQVVKKAVDFGDYYRLVIEDAAPKMASEQLRLTVGYSGCSDNHPFKVDYRVINSKAAEVWLVHDGLGEACEKFITESRTLDLPKALLAFEKIMLQVPGAEPISLR